MGGERGGRFDVTFATSDAAAMDLVSRYWRTDADGQWDETVATIADDLGLRTNEVSRAVPDLATVVDTWSRCPRCGTAPEVRSRTAVGKAGPCQRCQAHKRRAEAEQRTAEAEAAARLAAIQKAAVAARFAPRSTLDFFDAADVSLLSACALLAAIGEGGDPPNEQIKPMRTWSRMLGPTHMFSADLLADLEATGTLAIAPTSPVEAFDWATKDSVRAYDPAAVAWYLPSAAGSGGLNAAAALIDGALRHEWIEGWHDQRHDLWVDVAKHEALAYLLVNLARHRLDGFVAGKETMRVLSFAVGNLSLGETYNIIYGAVRDAVVYKHQRRVSSLHAANRTVGLIETLTQRVLADQRACKPFRRDRQCPETPLSQVAFGIALGVDPFSIRPSPTVSTC